MTQQLASSELTMAHVYAREHLADPYPLYRRIRDVSPVFWDPRMGEAGAYMVTGYEVALTVLRDHQLFSARRPQWAPESGTEETAGPLRALYNQVFVSDPPEHTRLRKQLIKPFLPRPVERMRPAIEQVGNELLDLVAPRGEMDFMGDFAMALPGAIVCRILGIPLTDRDVVWRRILSWGLLVDGHPMSRENPDYHLASIGKYMDYFRAQLNRRRESRTDDLIQTLVDGWEAGGFASEEELLGNLIFMLTAGQTTTAHQIGNTMLALLAPENADAFRAIVDDPDLVPDATPEFMRYDCSVQLTKRRAVRPVDLLDKHIDEGAELFVWMGAAHRDPEAFIEPDRIMVDRPKLQNLALGHGAHYCLGGQLGQLVNEIAVQLFVTRIREPKVDFAKVERTATPTFRGPHLVPMTFG
jgi:cytochrome P450